MTKAFETAIAAAKTAFHDADEKGAAPDDCWTVAGKAFMASLDANGWVIVKREASEDLLMSMAIRFDHGLGVPGYYDQEMMGGNHQGRLKSTVITMRQLHEEVVGTGFHKPHKVDADAHN